MNKKISSVSNLSMVINQNQINVTKIDGHDYICLTDMAKSAGAERALHGWLRTKNTIDFLGFWEQLNNPSFKLHEFVYFKNNAGANSFNPSISEWVEKTNAKGTGEKIYHLPFDQQYDKTRIEKNRGELYCSTVLEAEGNGFRRAKRWMGLGSAKA